MAENKQYLISFLATIRGDKMVTDGLRKIEGRSKKVELAYKKLESANLRVGQGMNKVAKVMSHTVGRGMNKQGQMLQKHAYMWQNVNGKMMKTTYTARKVGQNWQRMNNTIRVTSSSLKKASGGMAGFAKLALRSITVIPIWFALRRIFMGIVSVISDMVRSWLELDDAMARIRTVVSASSDSIEGDMIAIERTILKMAVKTRKPLKELGEAFYYLRTANLSTKEAVEAFEPTLNAMVGTMNNAKDTARAVAGIYNTMGKYLGDNLTVHEKFTKIADVLTYTYACYTPDTEVLTDKGWKLFTKLDKTEKMATLNTETREIEYQKPTMYVNKSFDGRLCHIKGRFIDIMVTPKHKLYTAVGYKPIEKKYKLIETEKVFGRPKRFYRGSNWKGVEPKYFILPEIENKTGNGNPKKIPTKIWVRFLAWYLSEGCSTYLERKDPTYKVTIYQSQNSKHWDDLKEVMELMPFKFSIFHRGFIIHSKQLSIYLKQFGTSKVKFIPKFIKGLSKELLRLFIKTYAYGDGTFRKKNWGFQIITASNAMKDDLQEIALKANYGCVVAYQKPVKKQILGINTKSKENWRLYFNNRTEFLIYNKKNKYYAEKERRETDSKEEWVDYKGRVVCVEIPNHILFVRRNGRSFWCGNTQDVQLSELVQSYTKLAPYLSGLDDSFSDIVTTLGFLNTRLLRGGRTGRLTGRAIMQLTKNSKQLASVFGITFDPNKPINFLKVMEQISKTMKQTGKVTAEQGEALRQVFATRGGVAVRLLIEDFDDLSEAIRNADERSKGFAERMKEIRENTVPAQMERMKNILRVMFTEAIQGFYGGRGDIVTTIKGLNQALTDIINPIKTYGEVWDYAGEQIWKFGEMFQRVFRDKMNPEKMANPIKMVKGWMDFFKSYNLKPVGVGEWYRQREKSEAKIRNQRAKEAGIIEKEKKDKDEVQKLNSKFMKETNIQLTHRISLMKTLGANQLDIARYNLKELEVLRGRMTIEEYNLELLRRQNDVIQARLKYEKTLVNTYQKAKLDMAKAMGAPELQILQLQKEQIIANESIVGKTQTLLLLEQNRNKEAIALQRAKQRELSTITNLYMRYEKADKFEKARLRRMMELRQLKPKTLALRWRVDEYDRRIIEQYWGNFSAEGKKAVAEIIGRAENLPGRGLFGKREDMESRIKGLFAPDVASGFWTTWISEAKKAVQIFEKEWQEATTPKPEAALGALPSKKRTTLPFKSAGGYTFPYTFNTTIVLPEGTLDKVSEEAGKQLTEKLKTNEELQKFLATALRPYL